MSITDGPLFAEVREVVDDAVLGAWDGCHKIYLAMDEEEAAWFRAEYPHIVQGGGDVILAEVGRWWEESCGLRFVSAVRSNPSNPNAGFTHLIEQFADEDEEDDW